RRNFLTHKTGEGRCLLSIEIRLEPVTNRFVQQNAWPAWRKNDFHRSCRRFCCAELENCLSRALACNERRIQLAAENLNRAPAAASLIARLPAAIFLSNTHDV